MPYECVIAPHLSLISLHSVPQLERDISRRASTPCLHCPDCDLLWKYLSQFVTPRSAGNLSKVSSLDLMHIDLWASKQWLEVVSEYSKTCTNDGDGRQVELAAAEYQLPRLTRMWTHLERQAGGGKTRGMGEKQIEIDKRLLRERMARLRRDLTEVKGLGQNQGQLFLPKSIAVGCAAGRMKE